MSIDFDRSYGHKAPYYVSTSSAEYIFSGDTGFMHASEELGTSSQGELWVLDSPKRKKACIVSSDHSSILGYATLDLDNIGYRNKVTFLIQAGFPKYSPIWELDLGSSEPRLGRRLLLTVDKLLACSGGGKVFVADGSRDKWTSQQIQLNQHMGLIYPRWSDNDCYVYYVAPKSSVAVYNTFMLQCFHDFYRPET